MSRNIKNVKSSTPIQTYCKVCHDAGKSEAEYRSHFIRETRDPNSKVTCPTLLALECLYCYKNGHTVKYCSVLKNNEKKRNREEASSRHTESVSKTDIKPKCKSTNKNVFAVLDSDSEEEIVTKKNVHQKEEFPALSTREVTRIQQVSTNYAVALSKSIDVSPLSVISESKIESKPAPWSSGTQKTSTMKSSWAALSDSESDEENEQVSIYSTPSYTRQAFDVDYDSDW